MLASEPKWNAVIDYAAHVIRKLRLAERLGGATQWSRHVGCPTASPRQVMLNGGSAGWRALSSNKPTHYETRASYRLVNISSYPYEVPASKRL